jgi:hypothetical protein
MGSRRVEEERLTGTYWQPVVSLPRSSNRTCPFRASGSIRHGYDDKVYGTEVFARQSHPD